MESILKQFKQILVTVSLMLVILPVIAQVKHPTAVNLTHNPSSKRLAEFNRLAAQASVTFTFPKGFREVNAPDNEDLSFDYGMELPGKAFEIWFQVKSQKENWASYEHSKYMQNSGLANPDSVYNEIAAAQAISFTGDKSYIIRMIPAEVLSRYNADAGKTYLLTLLDRPETKHYKYALLITLQKNHTGTILAVCFTNEKGPEFFKNLDRAGSCLKFKS